MKGYPLIFRCYAEKSGSQWQAFCIDLTLAAQADTYESARAKLHEHISSYVYDAIAGEDQKFAAALLTRKAPLRYIAKYHVYIALDRFQHAKETMGRGFSEALNATALVRQHC